MKIPAVLLSVCCLVSTASARIGETPAECAARYGEPVSFDADDQSQTFRKGNMMVVAYFHEGRCDMIVFSKLGRGEELSDNEIEVLLDANGGGRKWKRRAVFSIDEIWDTDDNELIAQRATANGMLFILTRAHYERDETKRKREEREKLNGF